MRLFLLAGLAALAVSACGDRPPPTVSDTPPLDIPRLNGDMEGLAARARPGLLGVGIVNLENGATYTLNGDRAFPMQGVFKAPLGAAVLAEVDAGRLQLGEVIRLRDQDLSPPYSPVAAAYPARRDHTVAELLAAAVGGGDNTAADVLMKRIGGPGAVTAWLQSKRVGEVRVDRYERQLQPELAAMASFRPGWKDAPAYLAARSAVGVEARRASAMAYLADRRDTATPRGMLDFLQQLARGELLSPDSTRRLMQIMAQAPAGQGRLKAGFPPGSRLAHAAGSSPDDLGFSPATNDVGVLTLPDGRRYAVAVFLAASPLDEQGRDALIADVARALRRGLG